MTKNIKKSVSILLAVIMVFSLFTIVPFTANAAGTYNKDSEGIADGVIMEPGYVIDTANTSKFLMFDSSINIDYYHNGDESWYENVGASWRGVESFYINNNNEYICYNVVNDIDHDSRLIPHEGMTFKVSYDAENDLWHIAEIEIPVPKPKLIAGHTLTLDGNIGINFYIDPSAAGLTPETEFDAEDVITTSGVSPSGGSDPDFDPGTYELPNGY